MLTLKYVRVMHSKYTNACGQDFCYPPNRYFLTVITPFQYPKGVNRVFSLFYAFFALLGLLIFSLRNLILIGFRTIGLAILGGLIKCQVEQAIPRTNQVSHSV